MLTVTCSGLQTLADAQPYDARPMSVTTTQVADPVRLELVKNALATIAEEMGLSVVRSAYSSMVKESGDSTAAVFDAGGRLLAQSPAAPLSHLASLRPSLQYLLARHPVEGMLEGDIRRDDRRAGRTRARARVPQPDGVSSLGPRRGGGGRAVVLERVLPQTDAHLRPAGERPVGGDR